MQYGSQEVKQRNAIWSGTQDIKYGVANHGSASPCIHVTRWEKTSTAQWQHGLTERVGKGGAMPKKNRRSKNKLGKNDALLFNLGRSGPFADPNDEEKRLSLIRWHSAKGFFTIAQFGLAIGLLKSNKRFNESEKERKSKYYLYAISNGMEVKLEFSTNVKSRIKAMQTSSPTKLESKWTYFVGYDRGFAMKQEKKLHRFCKAHRINGEWFSMECMPLIAEFHVRTHAEIEADKAPQHPMMISSIASFV